MRQRAWLLAIAIVAIAVALLAVRPHATPGPTLRDFEAYHAAGAAWIRGDDPYSRAVWSDERTVPGVDASRDELLPFVGPPPSLPLLGLFARFPYAQATVIWSTVLALALVATLVLTLRLARAPLSLAALLATAALAVGFAPITSDLALGQVALLAFAGALLAIDTYDRQTLGASAGTIVAALQPNVALPLVSMVTNRRGLLSVVIAALAVFALGAWVSGISWPFAYLHTLAAHTGAEMLSAIQQTPAAVAFGFGVDPNAARVLGRAVSGVTVAAGLAVMLALRDPRHRFVTLCALLPWGATFFHEHDLLVAFAPAVWCARYARGGVRSFGLVATVLVAVDWLGLAQRPDGIAQSALLAAAAACGYLALHPNARGNTIDRSSLYALAALAIVFACGGWIGTHHPAPIWPDALGAYHAPASATAAGVWENEQRLTGLLDVQPPWALLRCFGLIGSALLTIATLKSPSASA